MGPPYRPVTTATVPFLEPSAISTRQPCSRTPRPSLSCSFLPRPTLFICFFDSLEASGADLPLSWSNRLLTGIGGYREISTVLFLQLSLLHQQTERIVNQIPAPRDPPGREDVADL